MSYILDALRKADRDRQVSRIPTLATAHASAESSRRAPWIWAGVGVLVVTAAVVYSLLGGLRDQAPVREAGPPSAIVPAAPVAGVSGETGPPRQSSEPAAARDPAAPSGAATLSPGRPEPVRPRATPGAPVTPVTKAPPAARIAGGDPPARASSDPPPPGPPPARAQASPPLPPPAKVDPAPPARVDPAPPARGGGEAGAPPAAATPAPPTEPAAGGPVPAPSVPPAPAAGAPTPPPARLSLDVLVYSDVPAERLVFINGRKYVEGQAVDGDTVVEQITADGVILLSQGTRILLRPKLNPYARPRSP